MSGLRSCNVLCLLVGLGEVADANSESDTGSRYQSECKSDDPDDFPTYLNQHTKQVGFIHTTWHNFFAIMFGAGGINEIDDVWVLGVGCYDQRE